MCIAGYCLNVSFHVKPSSLTQGNVLMTLVLTVIPQSIAVSGSGMSADTYQFFVGFDLSAVNI